MTSVIGGGACLIASVIIYLLFGAHIAAKQRGWHPEAGSIGDDLDADAIDHGHPAGEAIANG